MIVFNHTKISRQLVWNDGQHISELVIENPVFLRELVSDLSVPDQNLPFSFSHGDNILSVEKDCDLITNPTQLNFNNRRAITTLLKMLVKTSLSEDFYMPTNRLKAKIVKYIDEVVDSENFIFEIATDDFTIDTIAKAINIHIVSDDDDFIEILTDYMSMTSELAGVKLFIFLNLRAFITDDELEQLRHNLANHQMDALLIEGKDAGKIPGIDRILVDSDLCEI